MLSWLSGKKTYITAVIALLTALVAVLDKTMGGAEFVAAVFVIAQTVFIRAGINKAAVDAVAKMAGDVADAVKAAKKS
jgi:hypothetical protein